MDKLVGDEIDEKYNFILEMWEKEAELFLLELLGIL